MTDWIIAVLPLAGVVVGAALQFWFSRASERRKQLEVLRAESYVDYLRSVANAAHASSTDELRVARKAAADAKSRIVVYGTADVVVALAQFEQANPVLNNDRSCRALASTMRQKRDRAGIEAIQLVLMGTAQQADAANRPSTTR